MSMFTKEVKVTQFDEDLLKKGDVVDFSLFVGSTAESTKRGTVVNVTPQKVVIRANHREYIIMIKDVVSGAHVIEGAVVDVPMNQNSIIATLKAVKEIIEVIEIGGDLGDEATSTEYKELTKARDQLQLCIDNTIKTP